MAKINLQKTSWHGNILNKGKKILSIFVHLSSASPRGGPLADVGTLQIVHFTVLVFPHPWGSFCLQSPQYLAKQSTQLASELYFGSLNS